MPTRISYDGMSRLTSAGYLENGKRNNHFSTSCKYDLMGNILSLRREGLLNSGNYGTIDDLAYTYDGNQVIKIDDSVEESPCYDGAMHFVDGAAKDEEYTYDANGNMTSDLNKRVLHIDYNALNLPQQIAVEALRVGSGATNNIKYTYAADGTKLRAEYTGKLLFTPIIMPSMGGSTIGDYPSIGDGSVTDKNSFIGSGSNVGGDSEVGGGTYIVADSIINVIPSTPYSRTSTIDYCANLIYENKRLSCILFDGGYASVDKDDNIVMHYYVKDHLGSNRLVVDGNGNIEDINHYYPFGALMGDSKNTKKNRFKYVGKELDRMYGIDMQDHGARWYDPIVGRWNCIDPLSVKYNSHSMYVSCLNNPLLYLDTNGESVTLYATVLPGNDYLTTPTHTFLVVRNKKGEVVKYYAYGPEHDGIRGLIGDKLTRVEYNDDKAIIRGENKERLKAVIEIIPPKGMTSEEFDKKIIQTAESFGNNDNIVYDLLPITDVTGNCNSSTSTILIKSGVGEKEMKRIKAKIPGLNIGFSIDKEKPWTKEEQKKGLIR